METVECRKNKKYKDDARLTRLHNRASFPHAAHRHRVTGAHILSGNVFEPRALDELLPGWRDAGAPIATPVKDDNFLVLGEKSSIRIPNFLHPPQIHNGVSVV